MNDKITDSDLVLWADGLLDPERQALVEQHLEANPALRLQLENSRELSATLRQEIPGNIEPPYPDFFNSRILRDIQEAPAESQAARKPSLFERFQWLVLPASLAAVALAFFAGTRLGNPTGPTGPTSVAETSQPRPSLYLPTTDMQAQVFSAEHGELNLIVLDGLNAIPDEKELARNFPPSTSQVNEIQFISHRTDFF